MHGSKASDIATAVKTLKEDAFAISVISNDDDSKIDTIVKTPMLFSKITATTSTTVTYKVCNTKGGTTSVGEKLNFEDDTPEMYDGFKKDDYVFVDTDLHTGNTTFTKAEKISGKVSASKKNEVKVDGSWYKLTYTDKKDKGCWTPTRTLSCMYAATMLTTLMVLFLATWIPCF